MKSYAQDLKERPKFSEESGIAGREYRLIQRGAIAIAIKAENAPLGFAEELAFCSTMSSCTGDDVAV